MQLPLLSLPLKPLPPLQLYGTLSSFLAPKHSHSHICTQKLGSIYEREHVGSVLLSLGHLTYYNFSCDPCNFIFLYSLVKSQHEYMYPIFTIIIYILLWYYFFLQKINFYICLFCLLTCLCTTCVPGTQEGQKRVSDSLKLKNSCQSPSEFWKLSLGPLQEQVL